MKIHTLLTVFVAFVVPVQIFAASSIESSYPELTMVPKNTERVDREVKLYSPWSAQSPVLASGAATLISGILELSYYNPSKDPSGYSPFAGIAVGSAWVATGVALSIYYNPYLNIQKELSQVESKTERDRLTRERMAESGIDRAAHLGRIISWLSFASNLGASGYMVAMSQSKSLGFVSCLISAGFAVSPILFQNYWVQVSSEQHDYKKRIYAPMAALGWSGIYGQKEISPVALLRWSF